MLKPIYLFYLIFSIAFSNTAFLVKKDCCEEEYNSGCHEENHCEKKCCVYSKTLIEIKIEGFTQSELGKKLNLEYLPFSTSLYFNFQQSLWEKKKKELSIFKRKKSKVNKTQALYCSFIFYG